MNALGVNWFGGLAVAIAGALFVTAIVVARRKAELRRFELSYRERQIARVRGSDKAQLQYPDIDLTRCVGCGACVAACPEDGVLDLLHGQAVVVHGARCVGHARCADACPTGAISVTLGDISDRRDLPAIDENLEVVGVPGMYLAGELTGFALVRTAVAHGATVATTVARALEQQATIADEQELKLLIIGSGPAGIACALRAKELGIKAAIIEQAEQIGGTVAGYPRRKMVMTQPLHLPLHGTLPELEYQKEDLIELWEHLALLHELDVRTATRVTGITREDERFHVETTAGTFTAHRVCLALGRRGTPRKLGVPGEDLAKVLYSLIDAESYKNSRILVVGGGDSAAEAAIGLSLQEGNDVTLAHRGPALTRVKAKNEARVAEAASAGRLRVLADSSMVALDDHSATLTVGTGDRAETITLENDFVFALIGGIPPFKLLEDAGVSFDPADMPPSVVSAQQRSGLLAPLAALLAVSVLIGAWVVWHWSYYDTPAALRSSHADHQLLRPSGPVALPLGVFAVALFCWNLSYLLRRSRRLGKLLPGSLTFWMGSHIFTGLLAYLIVMVHAGFTTRQTVGGHSFIALTIVIASGLVGRYLYSFVPRAANGGELALEQLRSRLTSLSGEWDRHGRGFGAQIRDRVEHLTDEARWRGGLIARIQHMVLGQFRLRRMLRDLRSEASREGVSSDVLQEVEVLARSAFRTSLQIAHYEEIRAVLSSWRYIHRWLALLMVLLVIAHIVTAARYADLAWPWSGGAAS